MVNQVVDLGEKQQDVENPLANRTPDNHGLFTPRNSNPTSYKAAKNYNPNPDHHPVHRDPPGSRPRLIRRDTSCCRRIRFASFSRSSSKRRSAVDRDVFISCSTLSKGKCAPFLGTFWRVISRVFSISRRSCWLWCGLYRLAFGIRR